MNLADFLRFRGLLSVAVGAGVMIGAAGVFLYHQLIAERKRMMLQREVARLGLTVSEMKNELELLRKQNSKRVTWKQRSVSSSDTEKEQDMHSAFDIESSVDAEDLDEYFDFSDDESTLLLSLKETQDKELDPKLVQLFSNVDHLLKGDTEDKKSAYCLLQEYEKEFPDSVDLLWRLAKASHAMSEISDKNDSERRKELILQGCSYAEKALERDDSCPEAHKWFAVTIGSRGEFMSIREKIADGYVFKQHVDIALKLNPNDPSLHHLSGRFKYEVAGLTWIERTFAKRLFAEFPVATFEEALMDFLEAEKLSPVPWKENRLLLAKCYINESSIEDGVTWLERAVEVPISEPEDEAAHDEILALLKKHCPEKYIS